MHPERILLRLYALCRAAMLAQLFVSTALIPGEVSRTAGVAAVLSALTVQSVALLLVHHRRGGLRGAGPAWFDIVCAMAALMAMAMLLRHSADPRGVDLLYPYTVATMPVIGMTCRGVLAALPAPALASAVYAIAATSAGRAGPVLVVGDRAAAYGVATLAGWVLAKQLRAMSDGLNTARRTALETERILAREAERSRYSRELHAVSMAASRRDVERERERARILRVLHDRVLQTLEFVSREGWIEDRRIRDHVAAEAVWLRELVHGELGRPQDGLVAALDEVVARQTAQGLRVEMNVAGLGRHPVPDDIIDALSGAVTELLTNVRKHSGTAHAVLRAATTRDTVNVTVLDTGCGFNPIRPTAGIGLRESVLDRVRQAGGRVVITSEPGAGTHVDLSVPLPGA